MSTTLVLYDTTGAYGWLGELYGIMTANLASHFGAWKAEPVASYQKGQVNQYSAVIYIGSTYGEPIPTVFLSDVLATATPVIWIYDNIWQLTAYDSSFLSSYGWLWSGFDLSSVGQVKYKGQELSRFAGNPSGIMNYASVGSGVNVLATAVRSDSSTFPWALQSRNLTYIGENPLAYAAEGDRYLILCDLLFDALAPATVPRHRAMVRIENINPTSNPTQLKAIADALAGQDVPFGFGVTPQYLDPLGVYNGGVSKSVALWQAPSVGSALRYMQSKGGVMIETGWTHQYSNVANPYDGVTGDDFEFFRVTLNADKTLNFQGPVPGDSNVWAGERVVAAGLEFFFSGFLPPAIFEFPLYTASATDERTIAALFPARFDRALYFSGLLSGAPIDSTRFVGQYFPYVVRDVYGAKVLPEDLGSLEPTSVAEVTTAAQQSLVVRDGFASFYYDCRNPASYLTTAVAGIKNLGYSFVSPASLI